MLGRSLSQAKKTSGLERDLWPESCQVTDSYYFEKLGGSVVALADSARAVVAYHDYKWQGLVQLQGVGADGLYFTADDTKGAVANTYGHYFSEGRRIDFETGHYLEEGMTRFYDAVNGRKLQPSDDMWIYSRWGLRYNQDPNQYPESHFPHRCGLFILETNNINDKNTAS